jgi:hypothetical protein
MSMQPPGQPPFQPLGGMPSQPSYSQGNPYPSQPYSPQGQWPGVMPPPQMPSQPPKKRSNLVWIIGGAVALVLVCCIAGIAVINGSKNSANTTTSNSTSSPTTKNSGGGHHKIGETVTTATWQVTINSASAYAGDPNQLDVPQDGDTFLVVEGTFKNLDKQSQTLSTILMFELQDSKGNKYDEALLTSVTGPDGTVLANGPAHGKWGYEVPKSVHTFILIFSEDFGQTSTTWDVSI